MSDDDLISRLRREAGPTPSHDPFFDLPLAREVAVAGDGAYRGSATRCPASARRPAPVQGAYGVPAADAVRCELKAGHPGPHRAGFTRTHVLHKWRAFEWGA